MDNYVDGFGNKRNWKNYRNKDLPVSQTVTQVSPPQSTMTFRALVRSEEKRDPLNDIGAIKTSKKKIKGTDFTAVSHPKKLGKSGLPPKLQFIQYLVTVRFHEVKFSEQGTQKFNTPFMVDGEQVFAKVPSIKENPVMIKCQCRDFQMVWEKPLADGNGLWPNNKWTRYERVTPPSGLPPRNPNEKMGYCKHIQNFLEYLYANEMIGNG
jgi:hypothetical protein